MGLEIKTSHELCGPAVTYRVKTPFQGFRSKRKLTPRFNLKSFQNLILIGLIATALFWHAPGQVSGDGPAANSNPLSTPNPKPTVVPSSHTSFDPSPGTPGTPNTQPVDFPLSMPVAFFMAFLLSMYWQKFGNDPGGVKGEAPSRVLKSLIREVEESSGYTRNDARAKAKAWLVENVTSLGENEIFLAKTHFNYLLPADWGVKA
jgi:hypothetical protein